jgi:Guanine nucleotide exchange factor synembryn
VFVAIHCISWNASMSDEFLQRLHVILSPLKEDEFYHEISAWNDELEALWKNPNVDVPSSIHPLNVDLVRDVSESLQCTFIELIQGRSIQKSLQNVANLSSRSDYIHGQLDPQLQLWKADRNNVMYAIEWPDLCIFVRTMKNWWRWYLQIYLSHHSKSQRLEQQADVAQPNIQDPWRAVAMLQLLLLLMEASVDRGASQPTETSLSDDAHHVANLLFYSTFPFSPNDRILKESYEFLIKKCQLMDRLLSLLVRPNVKMLLRLSVLRNVHNALASYGKIAINAVGKVSISSDTMSPMDWLHPNECNAFTFFSVFPDLLIHALTFPKYESWDDHRNAELVVETLRCCFALNVTLDPRWHGIFDAILQLDASQEPHFLDCQCAAIPMLMDAPRVFREHLSEGNVRALVDILDHQVTKVMHDRCVDDRAAAALDPILAVLYKLCVEHPAVRIATIRPLVFPDWDTQRAASTTPKNMSPADAPEGTLRWKLIQLLTWPQGFVKRLAGELLFVLCDSQQHEFIHRVGMGNAVAFLSVKGLIQLPGSVHA